MKFPKSPEECAPLAASFERISHQSVFTNCVGALDGYHLPIQPPSRSYTTDNNVRSSSYFSSHYESCGINIQACCDAHCRFTFLGIGGAGGITKDRAAVIDSGLADLIEGLPQGYICLADCAYQPTEKLIPLYGGDLELKNNDNANFNYFASQLRIRIEKAFALMIRKWGILHRPLSNDLPNIKDLITCIGCLHNICIDERLKVGEEDDVLLQSSRCHLPCQQLVYMDSCAVVSTSKNWTCVMCLSLFYLGLTPFRSIPTTY